MVFSMVDWLFVPKQTVETKDFDYLCIYQNVEYRTWKNKNKEKIKRRYDRDLKRGSNVSDGKTISFFKSDSALTPLSNLEVIGNHDSFSIASDKIIGSTVHYMSEFDHDEISDIGFRA